VKRGHLDGWALKMWRWSLRPGRVLFGCVLLLAAGNLAVSGAYAQDRDESWVISIIVAGKFDELRSLEKLSDQGVPFAMYWWGVILERCIFERCDKFAARELILRAAIAGNGRAKGHVLGGAETREEFDELVAKIGVPAGGRERAVYVARNLLFIETPPLLGGTPRASDAKVRTDLLAMAKSEPHVGMRAIVALLQGPSSTDLDVLAETGVEIISEQLMQRTIVRGMSAQQIIERARVGELGWAAAQCDTLMMRTGRTALDRDELEVGRLTPELRREWTTWPARPRSRDLLAGTIAVGLACKRAGRTHRVSGPPNVSGPPCSAAPCKRRAQSRLAFMITHRVNPDCPVRAEPQNDRRDAQHAPMPASLPLADALRSSLSCVPRGRHAMPVPRSVYLVVGATENASFAPLLTTHLSTRILNDRVN
jgi:hypothetical protein